MEELIGGTPKPVLLHVHSIIALIRGVHGGLIIHCYIDGCHVFLLT